MKKKVKKVTTKYQRIIDGTKVVVEASTSEDAEKQFTSYTKKK